MCLAVPGRLTEVFADGDVRMGKVDFDGVVRTVCLECLVEAVPGDYVLVHVGFALSRMDETEAKRVFELLGELGEFSDDSVKDGQPEAGSASEGSTSSKDETPGETFQ